MKCYIKFLKVCQKWYEIPELEELYELNELYFAYDYPILHDRGPYMRLKNLSGGYHVNPEIYGYAYDYEVIWK